MKSRKLIIIAAAFCIVAVLMMTMGSAVMAKGYAKPLAKNVIVLISDGCGYNGWLAADYYQYGKYGKQVYEKFPVRLAMSTYEWERTYEYVYDSAGNITGYTHTGYEIQGYDPEAMWSDFNYAMWNDPLDPAYLNNATDSASSATAMSTGTKTHDGALGVDVDHNVLPNITEYAESLGKATGVVSSVPISHATPAGFVAHNPNRGDYLSIADYMIYNSAVDVIMACGSADYDDAAQLRAAPKYKYVGESAWLDITDDGFVTGADANGNGSPDTWTVIRDQAEFQDMAKGKTPKRVLGIPKVYETLQAYRTGYDPSPEGPYTDPFNENVPTLEEMTKAALNVLDNDRDGFFLMVEGGAVDWAGHFGVNNNDGWLSYMIEEQIDFNRSVEAVCKWVQKNSNWGETMVIVTTDHDCGYLWGPDSNPDFNPIINNGKGQLPGAVWYHWFHSNALVPFHAKGDAARLFTKAAVNFDPVRGAYIDNTDIYNVVYTAFTGKECPGKWKAKWHKKHGNFHIPYGKAHGWGGSWGCDWW